VVLALAALCAPASLDAHGSSAGGLRYTITHSSVGAGKTKVLTAPCPNGTHVWSGGFVSIGDYGDFREEQTYPYDDGDGNSSPDDGWKIRAHAFDATDVTGYVICSKRNPSYESKGFVVGDATQGGEFENDCDQGNVVGGGISGEKRLRLNSSYPISDASGWGAYVDNPTNGDRKVKVHAICENVSSEVLGASDTVGVAQEDSVTATCDPGDFIYGGGNGNGGGFLSIAVVGDRPSSFAGVSDDDWQVFVDNHSAGTLTFTSYAICGPAV
jgi:hypothetical protein